MAIDDAEMLAQHPAPPGRKFATAVRHAREMHDILCEALREAPALGTEALLDLQETAAQVIERLEVMATRPRGPVH